MYYTIFCELPTQEILIMWHFPKHPFMWRKMIGNDYFFIVVDQSAIMLSL